MKPTKVQPPTQKRTRRCLKRVVSLSFCVIGIIIKKQWGVTYYDTVLQRYGTLEEIIVRGKPWPLGTKVDFIEQRQANEKVQV